MEKFNFTKIKNTSVLQKRLLKGLKYKVKGCEKYLQTTYLDIIPF